MPGLFTSVLLMFKQLAGRIFVDLNRRLSFWASTSATDSRGKKFASFGDRSMIMWKPTTIFNERYISIGSDTLIGPDVALSAGMVPGQECISEIVVSIGDRCLIGRGSGIVGHLRLFTKRALIAFVEDNGFHNTKTVGVPFPELPKFVRPIDTLLSKFPSIAGGLVMRADKQAR